MSSCLRLEPEDLSLKLKSIIETESMIDVSVSLHFRIDTQTARCHVFINFNTKLHSQSTEEAGSSRRQTRPRLFFSLKIYIQPRAQSCPGPEGRGWVFVPFWEPATTSSVCIDRVPRCPRKQEPLAKKQKKKWSGGGGGGGKNTKVQIPRKIIRIVALREISGLHSYLTLLRPRR